ncbi:histidine phosphatase family protein [Knoellia subterranea]|uniref:Phosphoglycerate kinase n=1 Tax=Knoellia subterranea KCTC 19937 TaxID=1385521 RepID=A0A0A0JQ58_9MICO|nr:histidine phosphatase family protein [Knoellia subterranea]KGN39308.1 phosphoglycerate kinase [Knoellia subterranea KCTC 19937]
MSDLFCPAILLVARHGDADYPHAKVLSDDGGWLTDKGRAQVSELATTLRSRNVAAVYTSSLQRAVESGTIAAEALGVESRVIDGLEEFSVGALAGRDHDDPELLGVFEAWKAGHLGTFIPGGESGADVLTRYRGALEEISDQHRGETILVFSHGGVMSFAIPRMGRNVRNDLAAQRFLPNCAVAEISIDADDVTVVCWPGSADRSVV